IITAQSSCADPNPQYEFWVLAPGASLYSLAQSYSTTNIFSLNTGGPTGVYRIDVWVRDANGPGAYSNSSGRYDAYNASLTYTLMVSCPSVSDSAQGSGTLVTFAATAPGCPSPQFEFWILSPGATSYTLVQPYSPIPTFTWNTVGNGRGIYRIN